MVEQVGPEHVLRLLLSSAFGLSFGYNENKSSEAYPLFKSQSKLKSQCIFIDELHSRYEEFFLICSNSVSSSRGIFSKRNEGLTIRATIFDICHSVSQSYSQILIPPVILSYVAPYLHCVGSPGSAVTRKERCGKARGILCLDPLRCAVFCCAICVHRNEINKNL